MEQKGREEKGDPNMLRQSFALSLVVSAIVHSRCSIVNIAMVARHLTERNSIGANVHALMYKEEIHVKIKE